jgi:hypothetical protein
VRFCQKTKRPPPPIPLLKVNQAILSCRFSYGKPAQPVFLAKSTIHVQSNRKATVQCDLIFTSGGQIYFLHVFMNSI